MSWYRVLALVCAVCSFSAVVAIAQATPTKAQGLTRYGMWGNNVRRHRARPSTPYNLQPSFALGGPAALKQGLRIKKKRRKPIELAEGGARPDIKPKQPKTVEFKTDQYQPGDIVIDTKRRALFLVLATEGYALAYPIAVGKRGFTWTGIEKVTHIQDWPDWYPPEEMRERSPNLPIRMTGGIKNPLGAKAIYLGKTLYRIHGTNARWSIGQASSSGCFRMHNAHVVHLAKLIDKSTTVHVLDRLPRGVVKYQAKKWKKKRRYKSKRRRLRRRPVSAI